MEIDQDLPALQRIQRLVRELGVSTTFLYLVDRLLRRVSGHCGFNYYIFMAQPLAERPRLPPARGRAFRFRLLKGHDAILDGLERPDNAIPQRFSQGAQCLLATKGDGDTVVGCIWFVRRVYAEDEVDVDYLLPEDDSCVWDFDVYVAASERLGFLFAKQWDTFDALLRPQGVRYTVSRINAFNRRSMSSHRSMGAQDFGWVLILKLGWFQWMVSNQSPFMAFGGRPKMRLNPADARRDKV